MSVIARWDWLESALKASGITRLPYNEVRYSKVRLYMGSDDEMGGDDSEMGGGDEMGGNGEEDPDILSVGNWSLEVGCCCYNCIN